MKIWANKYKKSVKASNEGRSDLIYVIMVNGDPVAKGSYDAMVKKSYTYSYPVQMLKFPKAKLNSLIKMAKDAHRPNPLKFAVNRFINDNTSEYDSLNASTNRNNVTASTKPSYRSGEEAIRNACNVINVFFAGKEPDMQDGLYNDTNTKYFVDQHKDGSGGIDTESVVQEWRETYDEEYDPRDYLFNILRDQLGYSYDEAERMLIYASTRRRPVRASITSGNIPYDLVSMLVALRDWVSIDDTDYINDEHRKLVDVADSLYNVGISVNEMSPEYQEVYNKYGKDFFDLVLDDVAALDSQLTSNNVNDLIEDYNDREASYTGVNASTKRRRSAKAVNASETSVTAAIDDGMHIIIDSKAYVDVTEDDFEQGEVGPYVNSWEFDVRGEYNSIGELVRAISENSYVFSEDVGDYYYMDGSIRTSATVDVDNSKPTDAQIDAWQRGEEKLYVADMYLDIKVGTVHEMTEDEARDFGISLY